MWSKLILVVAFVHSADAQCWRGDDKYISGLCYTISNEQKSFQDAKAACRNGNSNLAVIQNTAQANFLASFVRTQTGASDSFWIGLSRSSTNARFYWDDGTVMYWSNFDLNFPKDNLFVAESTINGKWRTLDGVQQLFYVCSYDPSGPPVTGGPSTQGYDVSTPNYGTPSVTGGPSPSTQGYDVSTLSYGTPSPYPTQGYDVSTLSSGTSGTYSFSTQGYDVSTPPSGTSGTDSPNTGYPASRTPSYDYPTTGDYASPTDY